MIARNSWKGIFAEGKLLEMDRIEEDSLPYPHGIQDRVRIHF